MTLNVLAYVDDITVVLKNVKVVQVLKDTLMSYDKVSSAKVNWVALWCGLDHQHSQAIYIGEDLGFSIYGCF